MDAGELLVFCGKVTEEAMLEWATGQDRVGAARGMLDAAILNLSFGNWPPPRTTCLLTTTAPSYTGQCL